MKSGKTLDNLELRSVEAQNIINKKAGFLDRYSLPLLGFILSAVVCFLLLCTYVERIKIDGKIAPETGKSDSTISPETYNKKYIGIRIFNNPLGIENRSSVQLQIYDKSGTEYGAIHGKLIVLFAVPNSNQLNATIEVDNESDIRLKQLRIRLIDLLFTGTIDKKKTSLFNTVYHSLFAGNHTPKKMAKKPFIRTHFINTLK